MKENQFNETERVEENYDWGQKEYEYIREFSNIYKNHEILTKINQLGYEGKKKNILIG